MDLLKVHKDFLPVESCARFVKYVEESNLWENNGDGDWNNRSVNLSKMDFTMREEMLDLRIRVKENMLQDYSITKNLFADIFQFVRWLPDNVLMPHADAENPDGSVHPFPYRNFAAVIYLNDNYRGGQIYFPNHDNFQPVITPGTLVTFPGTLEYLHGVTKIKSGTRYTIAGFFTYDETRADGYRI
jgi:hypothetical protein